MLTRRGFTVVAGCAICGIGERNEEPCGGIDRSGPQNGREPRQKKTVIGHARVSRVATMRHLCSARKLRPRRDSRLPVFGKYPWLGAGREEAIPMKAPP